MDEVLGKMQMLEYFILITRKKFLQPTAQPQLDIKNLW